MRHFSFFSLILLAFSCHATTLVDVYHAEITADKETTDEQARVQGMEAVIIRATGDKSAIKNKVVEKALSQSSEYVSQIVYDSHSGKQKIFKMKFSEKQINALLTQAQLPFWPAQRKSILVWFVEDKDLQRSIFWENVGRPEIKELKSLSEKRGLPVIVPVGDFDDITGIDASDVWGNFIQPVSRASLRYQPDAVLIVRAHEGKLQWSLYDQSPDEIADLAMTPVTGNASGETALDTMIDQLTRYYANKNAVIVQGNSSLSVKVQVAGLSRATDFFSLENALNQLSSVASVEVSEIQGQTVSYVVHLLTSQKEFEQEIASVGLIEKEPAADDGIVSEDMSIVSQGQPIVSEDQPIISEDQTEDTVSPAETHAGKNENMINSTGNPTETSMLYYRWKQ